jgi:hypothetical protein
VVAPVLMSHRRRVPSQEPVRQNWPSEEMTTSCRGRKREGRQAGRQAGRGRETGGAARGGSESVAARFVGRVWSPGVAHWTCDCNDSPTAAYAAHAVRKWTLPAG